MRWQELLRQPLLWLIRLYQKTLSPDHGWFKWLHPHGFCKYYPTCSEYSYQVIKKRISYLHKFSGGGNFHANISKGTN